MKHMTRTAITKLARPLLAVIFAPLLSVPAQAELGVDWEEVTPSPLSPRLNHGMVVHDRKLWVMGGNGSLSDVWSSDDGLSWNLVTDSAPWGPRDAVIASHESKLWLFGGFDGSLPYKNDVWNSVDGQNWTLVVENAAWPARNEHRVESFLGELWLMGGGYSDLWRSSDGEEWTLADADVPWGTRDAFATVVTPDAIYLMGGTTGGSVFYSDVWKTTNGTDWTLVTEDAGWSNRAFHDATFAGGRIWISGGTAIFGNPLGLQRDIWSSADGETWVLKSSSSFLGRDNHASAAFNGRLWIYGGFNGTTLGDLHFSESEPPTSPTCVPVLHVEFPESPTAPDGGIVTYDFLWQSSSGESLLVEGVVTGEAILRDGDNGITLSLGETWTLNATPFNDLGQAGETRQCIFRIGYDGSVSITGWIVR